MILSDSALLDLIANGLIKEPIEANQIQPASIDLRLGPGLKRFYEKDCYAPDIDVRSFNPEKEMRNVDTFRISGQECMRIRPGEFILGHTIETVRLPSHLVGKVEGRSSLGRLGLVVHVTAGFIDPGFEGQITLEFTNVSPRTLLVPVGWRVCQIALYTMDQPAMNPYGKGSKYFGQEGATGSMCERDAK